MNPFTTNSTVFAYKYWYCQFITTTQNFHCKINIGGGMHIFIPMLMQNVEIIELLLSKMKFSFNLIDIETPPPPNRHTPHSTTHPSWNIAHINFIVIYDTDFWRVLPMRFRQYFHSILFCLLCAQKQQNAQTHHVFDGIVWFWIFVFVSITSQSGALIVSYIVRNMNMFSAQLRHCMMFDIG